MGGWVYGGVFVVRSFSNEAYFKFFSTLADRTRLAIIDVLGDGDRSVFEVAGVLGLDEGVVLGHLEALEGCVVVTGRGSGAGRVFSLNREVVGPLSEVLSFHVEKYCPGLVKCISPGKLREYLKQEAEKNTYIEHE
jgi:DNA-binding transcriptional ArsR family regulator